MKNSISVLLLFLIVFISCQKNDDNKLVSIDDLKGKWKIVATKAGPDSLNPQGAWTNISYEKITTINELYCVNDSRIGQSFISHVNCAYNETAGSIVGVFSSDCARTIFMRDTVSMQLTAYDFILNDANTFEWVESYLHSKHVNTINQHCSPLQYIPESTSGFTNNGTWTFDEPAQMITINFNPGVNPYNGEKQSQFKVTRFTGNEVDLKMQGSVGMEFRLRK